LGGFVDFWLEWSRSRVKYGVGKGGDDPGAAWWRRSNV